MAGVKFEILNRIDSLKKEWNNLINKLDEPEVFYRYEWISNYIKYFDTGRKLCIVIGRSVGLVGGVVCILPFAYENKTITIVTRMATDYNSVYVDSIYNRYYILDKAVSFLLEQFEIKKVCLDVMKGNSELFLLQDVLRKNGFSVFLEEGSISPYLPLNILDSKMQKKELKDIERRERNLKSQHEVLFMTEHRLTQEVIEFISRHRAKKYGPNGSIKGNNADFYMHLSEELEEKFVVDKVYVDNKLAAAHFGFRTENKFYYYIPIYDEAFAKQGVGMILLKHIIENNQEVIFDFLRGNEAYKFYWCDNAIKTFRLLAYKYDKNGFVPIMLEKARNNRYLRKIMGR